MGGLLRRLADVVREISRANAVMRVPEERVRYSSPAVPEELEYRRPQEESDGEGAAPVGFTDEGPTDDAPRLSR